VGRRFGRVEDRIGSPDLAHVVDAERCMLEQVSRLALDLERVLVIEEAKVESIVRHTD
jgi:hypothetical protein